MDRKSLASVDDRLDIARAAKDTGKDTGTVTQMKSPKEKTDAVQIPDHTGIWLDKVKARQWYNGFTAASMFPPSDDAAGLKRSALALVLDNASIWRPLFEGGQKRSMATGIGISDSEWKQLCSKAPAHTCSEDDVTELIVSRGWSITTMQCRSDAHHIIDSELRKKQMEYVHELALQLLALDQATSSLFMDDLESKSSKAIATLYTSICEHLYSKEEANQETVTNTLRAKLIDMPSLHKRLAALCDNSSSDSDAKVPGDADSKLISYAFLNVPYIDDFTGMLKRFSAHLCNAAVEFAADRDSNGKRLIAPYVAVVQSSGFGKSRLLFEFSKRHLSFFICTRDKGGLSSFPPRSPLVADHLTPSAVDLQSVFSPSEFRNASLVVRYVTFFTSFFAACLYHLVDQFSTLNATWEKSASGGMNVSPTVPMCHAWVDRQLKSTLETQDAFWRSVIAIHRSVMTVCVGSTKTKYDPIDPATSLGVDSLNIPYTRASRILQHAACEVKRCIDANQSQDLLIPDTVAFVFDEARSFLQPVEDATDEKQTFLHYMRLAMYFFPREKIDGVKVVVALLDTFGSVAEYTPPTIPDPSLRFISDRRMYPPFVAFPHQARPLRDWNPPLNRDDIIKIWRHAGRHLWASYALPQHLLQVAEMKLSGGTAAISHNGINRMLHLAVIGTRVEFHFNSQSKLLLPLVHHHGATLYSVSTDRTIINVGYPSEPLLAAAATALTLKKSVKWTFLLGTLIEEVRTGLVPAGERGELTARALFLMALDFVRSHSSEEVQVMLTQTFTVRNLLNALFYGTERPHLDDLLGRQWGEKNKQRFLDQGIVNYTHFVYVTHSPRQSEIWRYFYNFAAIFCRRGQDVFDLVIPVYLKDAADYSYIVVQVKLHLQGTGLPSLPADVEVKGGLREEDSDAHRHPYLYVFLQLGQRSKPWKSELHMDKSGLLIAGSPMLRKVSMRGKHGGGQQMATIVQLSTAWVDPVDNVRDPPMSSSDSVAYDEHLDLNTSVLESLLHLSYPDTGGGGSNGDDAALDDTTVDDADEISNGRNSGGASTSANSTIKRKRYQ